MSAALLDPGADWTQFRTLDGLVMRSGVPADRLRRLVVKELTDNALDHAGDARVRERDGDDGEPL